MWLKTRKPERRYSQGMKAPQFSLEQQELILKMVAEPDADEIWEVLAFVVHEESGHQDEPVEAIPPAPVLER
jgi:hypothetical protein